MNYFLCSRTKHIMKNIAVGIFGRRSMEILEGRYLIGRR